VQKFLTILSRADATHLPEHTRKVLLGFEAAGYRDIQHAQLFGT
jgi:hypothetical protein